MKERKKERMYKLDDERMIEWSNKIKERQKEQINWSCQKYQMNEMMKKEGSLIDLLKMLIGQLLLQSLWHHQITISLIFF